MTSRFLNDEQRLRALFTQLGRHGRVLVGQEDQLAALGLVVNAVARWNSKYLSAAVDQLRVQGVRVKDADAVRLSPLGHAHLNCLGRYAITSSAPTEGLRQLGDILDLPNGDGQVDEEGI